MECGSHLFFWIISLKLKGYLLEGTIYHVSTTCIHPFTLSSLHVRGLILVAETCNTTSCLRYVMACKWEEAIKCNGEMLIWRNLAMEVGKIALVAIVYNLWKQGNNNFFFFLESFNLWRSLLMIALYHQSKTSISFWCRQGLNPRSLIQPSETLTVKLTRTHQGNNNWYSSLQLTWKNYFFGKI